MTDLPIQAQLKDPGVWSVVAVRGLSILARVVDLADGSLLTQAACTGISYTMYDDTDNERVVGTDSLTVASVVYNTEQTGDDWPYALGYNFKWLVPAALIDKRGHLYRARITVDPVSGEDFDIGGYGVQLRA